APDWPCNPGTGQNLFYETLLVFNTLSGEMRPLLAQSYQVLPDAIELTLEPRARFSDGTPVTPEDVQYSFELGRQYKSLRVATVWPFLRRIEAGPDGRVRFVLNPERKNPLVVLDSLQETYILPRHVIEPLLVGVKGDMNEFTKLKFDQKSVGSGPYDLYSYSAEKIATVRRDDYWGNDVLFGGKRAVAKYVVHPVYKSNSHYSVALQQGRLDASSAFMPRIWLKSPKGVRSWYDEAPFFAPGALPVLWLNHLHPPLDDVHLRRAMAFAIQYDDIRELAVSGYSVPVKPGLILPFGFESKFYSEEDAQKYGATFYDPKRARAELAAGGYQPVWDANGELQETRDASGGKLRTLFIKSPTGWTDWEAAVRIIVRSLRAVGIDARERFVDAAIWYPAQYAGDFDLLMATPSSAPTPSKPWSRFDAVLTVQDFAREGEKMYKNIGRFNDPSSPKYVPRFTELLDRIPTLTDPAELLSAYRELNVLFMQYQPVLPLVYRPDQFYEFSSRVWQGFSSADQPVFPPQIPSSRLGTRALWFLRLAGDQSVALAPPGSAP
ncbi:MAG TPA: ABC transporter substrate-binding protein, partial [Polyangiaceae bacterium]|nr:ABC transporter substrate-binding protein [Polyangiaceae bacterium]